MSLLRFVVLLLPLMIPSLAQADSRGQLLYENHCVSCHTSTVHVREKRKARDFTALRGWVVRWSTELKLKWGEEEQLAVTRYLNDRHYRYPAP